MDRKRWIFALTVAFLALYGLGWHNEGQAWSDGQLPHTANPNVYSCQNPGCHGGAPPDASLNVTTGTGSPCWNIGTNVILIQPVLATEINGIFSGGDTSLAEFGYTANITNINGGTVPGSIGSGSCMAGVVRRYTVNGLWFSETASPGSMYWVGTPGVFRQWGTVCTFSFNVNHLLYSDSIRVNICMVLSNADSTAGNDSTICKTIKLCFDGPLEAHTGGQEQAINTIDMRLYKKTMNGLQVGYRGEWRLMDFAGRTVARGKGRKFVSLAQGAYILELFYNNRSTKELITI
jgi:hypothetical protein